MAGQEGLRVETLSKNYGPTTVLKSISFTAGRGTVLGCIGANGSGKSTTMKLLLGLIQPTSGCIFFNGANIFEDLLAWRHKVGYVPELPAVYPHLSGFEHLMLVGRLRGLEENSLEKKARSLLVALSLGEHQDSHMAGYSKGMKQRVLIASALVHDPEILILDEPASGLDAETATLLHELIRVLRDSGKIVIYCSHTLSSVADICTRLIVLEKGECVAYGTTEEVQRVARSLQDVQPRFAEVSITAARDVACIIRR